MKIKITMLLIILTSLFLTLSCSDDSPTTKIPPKPKSPPTQSLQLAGQDFTVELAYTNPARRKGLMFRQSLPKNGGMLFIFARSQPQSFHMENCLIDLDIIFIKSHGLIAKIDTMKAPKPGQQSELYNCPSPVKYVLELPAGTAKKLNLKKGQKIKIPTRIRNIIPEY